MARFVGISAGMARLCVGLSVFVSFISASAAAQSQAPGSLTLQAATERALAANPTLAAARQGREVSVAGRAVAAEWLNPEATVEIAKEKPKQPDGIAVPPAPGGKRT